MPTTRFLLVRHGETLANREFRYIGSRDDVLSERGEEQAERLADALAIFPVAAVYSSPLARAYRTAQPIAARLQLDVQILSALTEGRFGAWEGLSRAEVLARGPLAEQQLRAWEADPTQVPPEGESFADVQTRVRTAIERLADMHPDQTLVLVSHVGPIKVLLCSALAAPLTSMFNIFLDPATISVIDWRPSHLTVRLINSHAHLGWEQARWINMR
ncbi:MAG TPA: histidine phosphatase family protein [Ktedonobacteraceae bacterium]|nr:histidine phosphatase family protein [Ktedonobacteraceae bacterium]